MAYAKENHKGFTLVEIILVVALMSALLGIGAVIDRTYIDRNNMEIALQTATHTLRKAQKNAISMNNDSSWSVHFEPSLITIYEGDDWNLRNTDFDIKYDVDSQISVSGITDITFEKMSGIPDTTGDITFTNAILWIQFLSI